MAKQKISKKTKIFVILAIVLAMTALVGLYVYDYYYIRYPEKRPGYVCCEESWNL